MYKELTQDTDGKEEITVKGKMSKGLLHRRIIWGTEYMNGYAGDAIQTMIEHHCIHPTDSRRMIPGIICDIEEKVEKCCCKHPIPMSWKNAKIYACLAISVIL